MSTTYGGLPISISTSFFWHIYVFFFRTTLCIVCNSRENIQDSSASSCSLCNREFNTKCRPSRCDICAKFFHRTNCLRDHNKQHHPNSRQMQRASLATSTTAVPRSTTSSVQASALPDPIYSQASFPQLQSTLTFFPIASSSSTSMSRTLSSQVQSSITFVPSSS